MADFILVILMRKLIASDGTKCRCRITQALVVKKMGSGNRSGDVLEECGALGDKGERKGFIGRQGGT